MHKNLNWAKMCTKNYNRQIKINDDVVFVVFGYIFSFIILIFGSYIDHRAIKIKL